MKTDSMRAANAPVPRKREPTAPSNPTRVPPPKVGARQLVQNQATLEPTLLSRNSNNSGRNVSNYDSGSADYSSSMASPGSEGESTPFHSELWRAREENMNDTSIHRPSPSVSLPEVSASSVIGSDGAGLSAPVLMLEAKLASFEQQHRFMLGSLDREYHTRWP